MENSPSIDIIVNGVQITTDEIGAELQYHPAENLLGAKHEATQALIVRELLLQKAAELGLSSHGEAIKNPDEIIDILLEKEITIPEADEATCERYYQNNKDKFMTSPLFDVSHILYLAPPSSDTAREQAEEKAAETIAKLKKDPALFEAIAKKESACSSAAQSGHLGQISKGQTMPAFETALFKMQEGELSKTPVATEVGFHIIRANNRADGAQLPFETVSQWIGDYLTEQSWQKAFQQYVQVLAGNADIKGFDFIGADSPLIQ